MSHSRVLRLRTATFLIVAMMIGTGIFTTSGYLLSDLGSRPAVLVAWAIGGIAALAGALCYAELGAAYPKNGGEYQLITELLHPALGFGAAVCSLLAGFAAPLAGSAMAFEAYAFEVLGASSMPPGIVASFAILSVSWAFLRSRRAAFGGQDAFTVLKVLLLATFVLVGLWHIPWATARTPEPRALGDAMGTPAFAAGLVYVAYAYTGWNTAIYLAGEVKEPQRNLPRAIAMGTLLVTALYLATTTVIIYADDVASLAGAGKTVTHHAAEALFGDSGARAISLMITLGLVSNIGALVAAGPAVSAAVGLRVRALSLLSRTSAGGGPVVATWLQAGAALVMVWTASFDAILVFVGASLSISSAATVLGLFRHRRRTTPEQESPRDAPVFRTPGYPVTPLVFLALAAWMLVFAVLEKPTVLAWSLGMYAAAGALYFVLTRRSS